MTRLLSLLLLTFSLLANITLGTYDAPGYRIAKTTSNGTTTYLIDANTPFAQVITETQENGTEIKYTYGNDLLSDGSQGYRGRVIMITLSPKSQSALK